MKKLCCPKCKNTDLQYVSSTSTSFSSTGGGYSGGKGCLGFLLFGPLGLLCGACGGKQKITSSQSTDQYWICKHCGEKFQDLKDLDSKIYVLEDSKDKLKILGYIGHIASTASMVIALFFANDIDAKTFFWTMTAFIEIITLIVTKVGSKSIENELYSLQLTRRTLEKKAYIEE